MPDIYRIHSFSKDSTHDDSVQTQWSDEQINMKRLNRKEEEENGRDGEIRREKEIEQEQK